MGKINMVIAGKYSGCDVDLIFDNLYIETGRYTTLDLDKQNIESYQLVDKNSHKSFTSRIVRGAVGRFFFGPWGLIAGVSMPKNEGAYLVSIRYKDGNESLIEISQKYYKALVKNMC